LAIGAGSGGAADDSRRVCDKLVRHDDAATGYVLASVAGGLAAATAGYWLGRRLR